MLWDGRKDRIAAVCMYYEAFSGEVIERQRKGTNDVKYLRCVLDGADSHIRLEIGRY